MLRNHDLQRLKSVYLDADGELRDHTSGIWANDGGAQDFAARVFLNGDLGEPLGDAFALAPVDICQLALQCFEAQSKERKDKMNFGESQKHVKEETPFSVNDPH